jgi:hypothetical protein
VKRLALGLVVALLLAATLAAQAGLTITFTISDDNTETARQLVASQIGHSPTDVELRAAIVQACRNELGWRLRRFKQEQDANVLEIMQTQLTETQRAQVRDYVLSLIK